MRQADILRACLDREVRCLKKWKRHLLPSGEKSSLLSLQQSPCLKKLVRTMKETKDWVSQGHSPGTPDTTGQKPALDVRRFFPIDCKNTCQVTCTLCHSTVRQGKIKGQSKTSGLVCPLVNKNGLGRERRPLAASPGRRGRGGGEAEGPTCKGHQPCPRGSPIIRTLPT